MTPLTMQDVSRQSGLSGPTLRDMLLRHAARIEREIAEQHTRLGYLRAKAVLWDARSRGDNDAEAEAEAQQRMIGAYQGLGAVR